MTTLGRAPTVSQFVDAWTTRFEKAVREGAGKDGRLSLNEARKIAERDDELKLWGDNAVNYLEAKGQKSVSVNKLIGAARRYAMSAASRVAGSNQRISLMEARLMPKDLVDDFFQLRGKAVDSAPQPAPPAALSFDVTAQPPITTSVDGDRITLSGNGAAAGTAATIRFDGHEVTVKKANRGFWAYDIGDRMPEGYAAEEIRSDALDPTTVRIVKDPPGTPSTSEALEIARKSLVDYLKETRIHERDWNGYWGSDWDEQVRNGVLEGIESFGKPDRDGDSEFEVSRHPDMYTFCGRGPYDLYTEVYVNKETGKARCYVEID